MNYGFVLYILNNLNILYAIQSIMGVEKKCMSIKQLEQIPEAGLKWLGVGQSSKNVALLGNFSHVRKF